jgi:outer membrane protein
MKKLLVLFVFAAMALSGVAQKFGHIDSVELLESMPQKKVVEQELEALATDLKGQLDEMQLSYETMVTQFQEKSVSWPEAVVQTKRNQILQLEQDMQNFQLTANQELEQKRISKLKPIIDDATAAIEAVAQANGFTYIFDASTGATVYNGGEDVLELVKAQLGL